MFTFVWVWESAINRMSKQVKYKQKLTTLDIAAEVVSLRAKLLGKR